MLGKLRIIFIVILAHFLPACGMNSGHSDLAATESMVPCGTHKNFVNVLCGKGITKWEWGKAYFNRYHNYGAWYERGQAWGFRDRNHPDYFTGCMTFGPWVHFPGPGVVEAKIHMEAHVKTFGKFRVRLSRNGTQGEDIKEWRYQNREKSVKGYGLFDEFVKIKKSERDVELMLCNPNSVHKFYIKKMSLTFRED